MSAQSFFVVTFVGRDRPGLVEAVAATVKKHGGNWEESRMARLAGEFAGILSVSVATGNADLLMAALEGLRQEGLELVVRESTETPAVYEAPVKLEIFGQDRPGIVEEASRALARRGVNVEDLHTETLSAPMTGESLFRATAMLRLPRGRSVEHLRKDLDALADELTLDLHVDE